MEIKAEHVKEFEKIIGDLDNLMKEIHEYCPEANVYVAATGINLMKGPSHAWREADPMRPLYENSVCDFELGYIGGGDW